MVCSPCECGQLQDYEDEDNLDWSVISVNYIENRDGSGPTYSRRITRDSFYEERNFNRFRSQVIQENHAEMAVADKLR